MSTAECPRCGWNRASTSDTSHILPHAAHSSVLSTDEIQLLEDQAHRLDEDISRLAEKRAAILRRINSARSATRRLPPEILSTIFQFVTPSFNFIPSFASDDFRMEEEPCVYEDAFQCDMAAVCHSWRQAAISTPQLWTSLSLGVHPDFSDVNLSLLNHFSEKVPQLPMSIELDFREDEHPWPSNRAEGLSLIDPIREAIFVKHADRIQSIRLIEPPGEWVPKLENVRQCNTLALIRPSLDGNREPVDLTEFPYLQHVVLVRPWCTFLLPRSGITTLHLSEVSCYISMELLINCPSLVEFESYSPAFCRQETYTPPTGPITLEQIELLTWGGNCCDCSPFIQQCIGYLRFSKLRTLQWYGDKYCCPVSRGKDTGLDLFSNLPNTLSSLSLHSFLDPDQAPFLKGLLSSIPRLHELCFIYCRADCIAAIINAIGRPVVLPSEDDQQPERTFLSHLSKLQVTSVWAPDGEIFVQMLEALHASRKSPQQLQLEITPPISWDSDSMARLQSLVASGFSVKINEDFLQFSE